MEEMGTGCCGNAAVDGGVYGDGDGAKLIIEDGVDISGDAAGEAIGLFSPCSKFCADGCCACACIAGSGFPYTPGLACSNLVAVSPYTPPLDFSAEPTACSC